MTQGSINTLIQARVPVALAERFERWQARTGMGRKELIKQIFEDWFAALEGTVEWSTRAQARWEQAKLRMQGIKSTITGGREHWRVISVNVTNDTKVPSAGGYDTLPRSGTIG